MNGDVFTKRLYTGHIKDGYIGENYELYNNEKLIKKVCTKIFRNGKYIAVTHDLLNNQIVIVNNNGINKFEYNCTNDNIKLEGKQVTYKDLFFNMR